ncbi:MAG: hypothetical protein IPL78_00790 [Chloroflexi bacterium]|nr:hypothetical protein [Chloroflexota bacterium]
MRPLRPRSVSNDVDMYGFDGLDGQRLTIDPPIRPDAYTSPYDPAVVRPGLPGLRQSGHIGRQRPLDHRRLPCPLTPTAPASTNSW